MGQSVVKRLFPPQVESLCHCVKWLLAKICLVVMGFGGVVVTNPSRDDAHTAK